MTTPDLTGLNFGKWVVISRAPDAIYGKDPKRTVRWNVRCQCGRERITDGRNLREGKSTSCGTAGCQKRRAYFTQQEMLIKAIFFRCRRAARIRNIPFSISHKDMELLIFEACFYCGKPPSNSITVGRKREDKANLKYSGLDRVENTKGYTVSNVVPCCAACNSMKGKRSVEEFKAHIGKICAHLGIAI